MRISKVVLWRVIRKLGLAGYRVAKSAARYYVAKYDTTTLRGTEKKAYVIKALREFLRARLGVDIPTWLLDWLVTQALARLRVEQGRLD